MGMTMTQKILAAHAGVDSVKAGDLITCSLDLVMANDITAPPSIAEFKCIGRPVFDRTRSSLFPTISSRPKTSSQQAWPRSSETSPASTTSRTTSNRAGSASSMPSFLKKAS